jgi:protein-S-isoprenylcysteine O-methyltransferase Ste14
LTQPTRRKKRTSREGCSALVGKGNDMTQQNPKGRKQHRNDLTGEHAFGGLGQLVLACLFFVTWIFDSFFLNYTTSINQYVSPSIRIPLGVVLLALAFYLATMGLSIVFGKRRESSGVIRASVFSVVRHPIYLSEILLYLGLLLLNLSLAAAFVWVVAILFFHYISRYEEGLLLARFGEEYEQYMREVPMWVPRLWKR